MTRRIVKIAALLVVAFLAYAAALAIALPQAHAVTCGGQSAMHPVPAGGVFVCVGSRTLLDGQQWAAHLTVNHDGTGNVVVTTPGNLPVAAPVPIEYEVHFGRSGAGGVTFAGVIPAGGTNVTIPFAVNLQQFAGFGCLAQHDVKAFNGAKDTATNRVRIIGPTVVWPSCVPTTTTTPTTVPTTTTPTTVPQSSPSTAPNTTTPTTPGGSSSPTTTPGTGAPASSVPGVIPATGPNAATQWMPGVGIAVLAAAVALIVVSRENANDD